MIVHVKDEWFPILGRLWEEAFGDDIQAAKRFFRGIFRNAHSWCDISKGEPVSVIYGIPALVWRDSDGYDKEPAEYLYAGATWKKERGKGHYGRVIDQAVTNCTQNGRKVFLVPAQGLAPFYRAHHFDTVMQEKDDYYDAKRCVWEEKRREENIIWETGKITAREYKKIRDAVLGRIGYVEWEEAFLDYAIQSAEIAEKITIKGKEELILANTFQGCLRILETTLDKELMPYFADSIMNQYCCDQICIRGNELMSTEKGWNPYFKIALDE